MNGGWSPAMWGRTLPCGHYIAEEAPEGLPAQALPFLVQTAL